MTGLAEIRDAGVRVGAVRDRLHGLLLDAFGIVRTLDDADAVALSLEIDLALVALRAEVDEAGRLIDDYEKGREF